MATISELIIAASVDATGVKRGLDAASGQFREFASDVETALDRLPAGASLDGVKIAEAVLKSASDTFRANNTRLTQDFFSGAISEARFRDEGLKLAQGFNASLIGGLQLLRQDLGLNENNGLAALETLTSKFKREGRLHGEAYVEGLANSVSTGGERAFAPLLELASERGPLTGIARRIGVIGVGASFAFEQLAEGGNRGEGAMRRVMRSVGILGIAIGGPEGALVGAIALGFTALMDFLHRTEAEAKKAADEIRKHIAGAANAGRADDLFAQARNVEFGSPYGDKGQAIAPSSRVAGAYSGSVADLRAQAAEIGTKIADAQNLLEKSFWASRLQALHALLDPQEQLLRDIQTAAATLKSQQADDVGKLAAITITADSPDRRFKSGRDRGPYAELKDQVGELTTAYEAMRKAGTPVGDLQTRLNTIFGTTARTLDGLTDKTGAAANALRAILADITNAGANNPAGSAITEAASTVTIGGNAGPDGGALSAQIERVQALRDQYGELSPTAIAAEQGIAQALEGVNRLIAWQADQGLPVSLDLYRKQKELLTEIGDEQKSQGATLFTAADLKALDIPGHLKAVGIELKGNNEQWTAMAEGIRGVIELASGLGIVGANAARVGSGALTALSSLKTLQKERAPGGDGAMSLAGIGAIFGVVGGVVSAVASFASMFTQHDAALERNSATLEKLRLALDGDKGLSGQTNALAAVTQLVDTLHDWGSVQPGVAIAQWEQSLAASGLSLDQLKAQAAALGIELDGTTKSYEQFQQALQLAMAGAQKFSRSLTDQTALARLHDTVYGTDSPADQIASTIALLKQFAPKLAAGFDGINAATEDGQQKLRGALEALYQQLAAGTLSTADFGTLGGAKDLATLMDTLAGSLNALNKSASSAAASLLYVPAGYKVALARFNATSAVPAPLASAGSPLDARPSIPTGTGTMIAQMQQSSAAPPTLVVSGDINIDAKQLTPDQLFALVLKAAQRRSQTLYGRTDQWSRVQTAGAVTRG